MKKLLITAKYYCCALLLFASCESHETNADDAFEHVKNQKEMARDTSMTAITAQAIIKSKPTEKVKVVVNEWDVFKVETDKKIFANEVTIAAIKLVPNISAKQLRKISSLEQNNKDLRKKMDVFNENATVLWENFKTDINHSINEIDIELKDMNGEVVR